MEDRYVVDTNVLIAGSACDPGSTVAGVATPDDPILREKVRQWLASFESSVSRMVIDGNMRIDREYRNNLGPMDYGMQVFMHKWSVCQVDIVDVSYDTNGHAVLDEYLQAIVHDLEDRKMVAAAVSAIVEHGNCAISFASDSDWHGWESALVGNGIVLEPIIPEWSLKKFKEKTNG